jgi:hypothetical protein
MSDSPLEAVCPACDGPVDAVARRCPHCGELFELPRHRNGMNGLVLAGLASILWWLPGSVCLGGAFSGAGPMSVLYGGLFACGLGVTVVGVVIGWFDLRGMRAGRLNPQRRSGTLAGVWVCGIVTLLYWGTVGYCILQLL